MCYNKINYMKGTDQMNKKLLSLVLIAALVLSLLLVSCGKGSKEKGLTDLAESDPIEYTKDVTRYASKAAAESLKPTKVLNEILTSSKVTLDFGDLEVPVGAVVAYINENKAYLSVTAGEQYGDQELDIYADAEKLIVDMTKIDNEEINGTYKIAPADLIKGAMQLFLQLNSDRIPEGLDYAADIDFNKDGSEVEEFIEKVKNAVNDAVDSNVVTEKIDAYGKKVNCIHTTKSFGNATVEKLINSVFPLVKDIVKSDDFPEDITASKIVEEFNELGVVFNAKSDSFVDADTGLPVKSVVTFEVDASALSEKAPELPISNIANGKINAEIILNYPENCSLLNNADLTVKISANNSSMTASAKWIVSNTDDAFSGKVNITLPGNPEAIDLIKIDHNKKTNDLIVNVVNQIILNSKLEYTDDSVTFTLVSLQHSENEYDFDTDRVVENTVITDLHNVSVKIEKTADFPVVPVGAKEVTFDELVNILGGQYN